MIQIIAGGKGKGKTKILLDKVNADVLTAKGSLVYLDKNTKHMYELNNKVRLISVTDYMVVDENAFLGFIGSKSLNARKNWTSTRFMTPFMRWHATKHATARASKDCISVILANNQNSGIPEF